MKERRRSKGEAGQEGKRSKRGGTDGATADSGPTWCAHTSPTDGQLGCSTSHVTCCSLFCARASIRDSQHRERGAGWRQANSRAPLTCSTRRLCVPSPYRKDHGGLCHVSMQDGQVRSARMQSLPQCAQLGTGCVLNRAFLKSLRISATLTAVRTSVPGVRRRCCSVDSASSKCCKAQST